MSAGAAPLVAGNWKMNTTVDEGVALALALRASNPPSDVDVVVLPPFTHLTQVAAALRGSDIAVGAQNCAWAQSGAFTGEVSATMLAGLCDWVLVGHSERRHVFAESDDDVARKARNGQAAGLRVMVAVGETEAERDDDVTADVVHRQLDAVFSALDAAAIGDGSGWVVAYEPVWAIGTGRTATPGQAEEVCALVHTRLARHIGGAAAAVRVLYGGSVNDGNAAELFACPSIDGALVGGASLKAGDFAAIIAAAQAAASR